MSQTLLLKAQITGVTRSKGEYEGRPFDKTTVFVSTAFDESKGNALGSGVTEYRFGTSENFERFKNQTFPFTAEIMCEMVAQGRQSALVMVDFKPIPYKAATGA